MWTTLANFWKYKANELGEIRKVYYHTVAEEAEPIIQLSDGTSFIELRDGKNILLRQSVAEVIAATFLSNPNNYTKIIHLDNNLANNAANNLKYVSDEEYEEYIHKKNEPKPMTTDNITLTESLPIESQAPVVKTRPRKKNTQSQINNGQQ